MVERRGAEEMVLAAGNRRTAQLRRVRKGGFTKHRREVFLNTLAATCNVGLAIQASGVCNSTVYKMRRRDPEFAGHWQQALEVAYERLETALLARAMGTDAAAMPDFDFADPETILPESRIDADLAIRLLARYRATPDGRVRPGPRRRHVATAEETNAALAKKLAILRRQIEQRPSPESERPFSTGGPEAKGMAEPPENER